MTTDEFLTLDPDARATWWGTTPDDDASKLALSRAALQGDVALQHALTDAQRAWSRRESARREDARNNKLGE